MRQRLVKSEIRRKKISSFNISTTISQFLSSTLTPCTHTTSDLLSVVCCVNFKSMGLLLKIKFSRWKPRRKCPVRVIWMTNISTLVAVAQWYNVCFVRRRSQVFTDRGRELLPTDTANCCRQRSRVLTYRYIELLPTEFAGCGPQISRVVTERSRELLPTEITSCHHQKSRLVTYRYH